MNANRHPLEELWTRMLALYGYRWESAYGLTPAGVTGDTWGACLADLTPAQIGHGVAQCVRSGDDWPPPLPLFRARCLGIPTLAAVKLDLRHNDHEPAPFTRMVWSMIDGYAYRKAPTDQAERMVRDAYELARERVLGGERLPEPSESIGQEKPPRPRTANPVVARRHIRAIGATLGIRDGRTAAAGPDA